MVLGRRGPLSKLIGGTVGITKEYQADRAARKEAEASEQGDGTERDHRNVEVKADDNSDDDNDEAYLQDLDDAQREAGGTYETEKSQEDGGNWMDNFITKHPPSALIEQHVSNVLSMPVVMPERRPGMKTRGFVRAYSNVLGEAGIDQDTWLEFLGGFEKSIADNKFFHVANAAVWAADKVVLLTAGVSLTAKIVSFAMHVSLETARRGYMNVKQNTFLDRMNDEFFKLRGLYCLIIKYDPKSNEPDETVDLETKLVSQVAKRETEDKAKWKTAFRGAADKTRHDEEMPDFAPLIFPELDKLEEAQKENEVRRFGHVLGDYYDRRAQAKFDADHEGSKLAGLAGETQFASRYSDPNHPASQGGLISTVSGGNVQLKGPLTRLRESPRTRLSRFSVGQKVRPEAGKPKKRERPMKRLFKQDVLYLMVVNLPTREEQEAVLAELERLKKEKA